MTKLIKKSLIDISFEGIGRIENTEIRNALKEVYESKNVKEVAALAESVFDRLTTSNWPVEILCKFISGWRTTHGTALFVSGLMVRMLREAKLYNSQLLYQAVHEIGEIISEDSGVDDTPHNELFDFFANGIIGNDSWKLKIYQLPECEKFRNFVKQERLKANFDEAILVTAASENWNTGEYSYFTQFVKSWMIDKIGLNVDESNIAAAYVEGHSGETELSHFIHAIDAWIIVCKARGKQPDANFAKVVFQKYIAAIKPAYNELNSLFINC